MQESARAAIITRHGGPEVLGVGRVGVAGPRPGHVLVKVDAGGLNFHDVIERTVGYPGQAVPPMRTGLEGAGTVAALGEDATDLDVGSRVMWSAVPGSHAEFIEVPAAMAIPIPPWLDASSAAAICAQGLTAHYLATSLKDLQEGSTSLVWAAAGGVGRLLTQILSAKGVRVLAAASSPEKADVAGGAGAERAVLNSEVPAAVADMTGGEGVDVVFDGVGAPTFDTDLGCVRKRGLVVVYGRAGGQVPPIDITRLSGAGSVSLVRPRLADFTQTRAELLGRADELLAWLRSGVVTVRIDSAFSLDGIADAHRRLESRSVIGKVIITP